jgi:hypothetical protein
MRGEGGDGHQGPEAGGGGEAHEREKLVTTIVGSIGGSGSSWTRRARAPEERAQVGRLKKQCRELGTIW